MQPRPRDARQRAPAWRVAAAGLCLQACLCPGLPAAAAAPLAEAVAPVPPDAAAHHDQQAGNTPLALWVVPSAALEWHVMSNLDTVGLGAGGPLYVAPNLAVMMLEVALHGGLVSSGKAAARQKVQTDADKALTPLQPLLAQMSPQQAEQAAEQAAGAAALVGSAAPDADRRDRVTIAPVFYLSPDLRAIAMQGAVSIDGNPMVTNLVRVVGVATDAAEPAAHWQANDGVALREQVGQLLAEAVRVAGHDAGKDSASGARPASFRYREGNLDHVERGTLVQADCSRLILRTLRGALYSVPLDAQSPYRPASCSVSVTGTASAAPH